jgi:hypothetical protein
MFYCVVLLSRRVQFLWKRAQSRLPTAVVVDDSGVDGEFPLDIQVITMFT